MSTPLPNPKFPNNAKPRLIRALKALSFGKPIWRHDLDNIVGTGNSPEYISQLRAMGWSITCERLARLDRDGRKTRVGRYLLQEEDLNLIQEAGL